MTVNPPDIEYAARTWLRAALPAVGGRVFFGMPAGTVPLPAITVGLLPGLGADPVNGIEYPRLTFQVWGSDKKTASDTRRALVGALQSLSSTLLDPETMCFSAFDIFSTWQPDDDAKLARYVVDATFAVKAVSLA